MLFPFLQPSRLLLLGSALFLSHTATALPVLPGAAGFGTQTPAGRGGTVLRVTTLADSKSNPPAGSLRWACQQNYPRTIVFDVSGIIQLKEDLYIDYPNVTIAGQTAPAPGVMLKNAALFVRTHDVLVQHIAVRTGNLVDSTNYPDLPGLKDRRCIILSSATPVYNVVLDHVSASWSVDEACTLWSDTSTIRDVTLQNCIISEALRNAGHPEGNHSSGIIFGRNTQRVSLVRSVMAHNAWRNPLVRDTVNHVNCVDNLVYRPDADEKANYYATGSMQGSVKGHVVYLNPDTESADEPWAVRAQAFTENDYISLFVRDNWVYNPNTGNSAPAYWRPLAGESPWDLVKKTGVVIPGHHIELETEPSIFLTTTSVSKLPVPKIPGGNTAIKSHVLANAGARPAASYRDPVDTRIVSQINGSTGGLIDNPSHVGGWPAWSTIVRSPGISLPANPSSLSSSGSGYNNLEEWLQGLASIVEGVGRGAIVLDSFNDGAITGANGSGDPNDIAWTSLNTTAAVTYAAQFASTGNTTGALKLDSTGNWAAAKGSGGAFNLAHGLAINESITVALDFRLISSIPSDVGGLRFGLGSNAATYAFSMGTGSLPGKSINVYAVNTISGTSTALTTSGTALAINNTTPHTLRLTLKRTASNTLKVDALLDGNAFSATHTGVTDFTFDRILMGEPGISMDFHVDNVKVCFVQ